MQAGAIGQPCFARVRSSHGGPAAGNWPLDPTWFYQEGSGPLLDMGVYGIHEITGILGPAKRVVAFSGITEQVRTVRGGPFKGKQIDVTADDNTLLMLDFGELGLRRRRRHIQRQRRQEPQDRDLRPCRHDQYLGSTIRIHPAPAAGDLPPGCRAGHRRLDHAARACERLGQPAPALPAGDPGQAPGGVRQRGQAPDPERRARPARAGDHDQGDRVGALRPCPGSSDDLLISAANSAAGALL